MNPPSLLGNVVHSAATTIQAEHPPRRNRLGGPRGSAVEGRNGQWALRHHCLRSIADSRLKALTVMHNYGIEDVDKTTPAQRFFGRKPERTASRKKERGARRNQPSA